MSALISRIANGSVVATISNIAGAVSMLRIAAFLLTLSILVATPGFASAHGSEHSGSSNDAVYVEDVIEQAVGDLDLIWANVLAGYGIAYLLPNVVVYTGDIDTACDVLTPGASYGMFCGTDDTIYIDAAAMDTLAGDHGLFAVAVAIADIWGYTIQDQFGTTAIVGFQDVQASCLAGAWAWYVWDAGLVSDDVLIDGMGYFETIEDGEFFAEVFLYGFETGSVLDCLDLVD